MCELLLRSLVAAGQYDQPDFCARLDVLLDSLDGTPYCGGDYTDVGWVWLWPTGRECVQAGQGNVGQTWEARCRQCGLCTRFADVAVHDVRVKLDGTQAGQ